MLAIDLFIQKTFHVQILVFNIDLAFQLSLNLFDFVSNYFDSIFETVLFYMEAVNLSRLIRLFIVDMIPKF